MENKNQNQKIALDLENSIWVSASAGSGKTTILVKRLIKLLISDVDISKIVCITYTRTAANEMKNRIYSELSNWVVADDEFLILKLKEIFGKDNIENNLLNKARILFAKVIDRIDDLNIFTIHSFCQQILKKFPIEAGLSPNFEIIEETASKNLIRKAIDEFLNNMNQDFLCIVKSIIKNEEQFYKLIGEIVDKRTDLSYIKSFNFDYKKEIYSIFGLNFEDNKEVLIKDFIENIPFDILLDIIDKTNSELTEEQKNRIFYIKDYKNLSFEEKIDKIENYLLVFLKSDFDLESENYTRSPINKIKRINEEYYQILDCERLRCFNFWQKLNNIIITELSINSIEVGLKIIDIYQKLKNEKFLLDYDDLIINTYKLLINTEYSAWINYKLDNSIEHILLDEAQDTSKMQWLLIQTITDEFFSSYNEKKRTIFIVGDEKQSIFKFQGANIEMFNERYRFYNEIINNSKNNFFKIDLNYSYRSLSNILKFVDLVFKGNEEKISKLTNEIKHNCIRINENDNGYIEVWPLSSVKDKKKDGWELDFSQEIENENKEKLAVDIANKIKSFIQNKKVITVRGIQRNVKYGDIMILYKKRDNIFTSYLIRNLNKNNIPNSGHDKFNLFNEIIINDFICLLNFTLFQNDDLNLANIIKSPFIGLSEEDLLKLCIYKNENKISLYETIKENCKEVYLFLNDIIEKSNKLSLYDLCNYILDNFDNRNKIINRFSEDIIDVINQFMLLVKNYEDNNNSSLISFLQYIKQNEIEIKKDLDFSSNQVKLMTIHASKGLQSPIIFLITNDFNINVNDNFVWNEDLYENKMPIYVKSDKTKKLLEQKETIKEKLYAEYIRLLYVALTRSENEIYVCGWSSKKEKENNNNNKKKDKKTEANDKYDGWYKLIEKSIKNIGKKQKFYFDNEKDFYFFGEEKYKIINEEKELISNKNNFINNIKKCKNNEISNKIINPSQYYKHYDRDNNLLNLDNSIIKGNAVHKLLEVLPKAKIEEREEIANIYLNNSFYTLTQEEREEIKNKVINVIDKYKEYFSYISKSEVPIVGEIDGEIISGQIDRLIIKDDEIVIIDYKNTIKNYNNEKQFPKEFIKQLELYKKLVSKIYENKPIKCYILLTSYLKMIEVNV